VVGVDAEKPGKAARELVTTISSSVAGSRVPPFAASVGAGPAPSAAYTPDIPASKSQVTVNPSDLIKAPLSSTTADAL
jgi:hypothetical protein